MTLPPTYSAELLARAAKIRLIGFDVDGTLTDGGLIYSSDNHESKCFHVQDGLGLVLLRQAGIATALVSARHSPVTAARGVDLKIPHLHIGERHKLARMRTIAAELGIGMDAVAFMGDDLPDLATLRDVGLAIVPADAHHWVQPAAHWVTPRRAGHGAARDACDLLLYAQGRVDAILEHGEHP
ncbi:MAG TPA: HAD hydrolase family protein [Thermomonas sp.]|jgi:3-deoxy-D-manno-octulosonate 8-phosphate phosphatase (KDO 8-P phosphatase)|uniref:KdsC family phosphatase n=1 Tax=Thermomonas sp. TaxID=1971895 RepID=UPI002CDB32D7|nr:HAD hydrolase family protein [Thermomonas sp.]HOV96181.1 HAD hydrolase family protein [Thermomonas sp.]